jgi:hypothetical protein
MEEERIYSIDKPKSELYRGIDYLTYILQYVNNPNVTFHQVIFNNNSEVVAPMVIPFTTDVFVGICKGELKGDIKLYSFQPQVDSGLPYLILNAILNGEDVFNLIDVSWALHKYPNNNRKTKNFGGAEQSMDFYFLYKKIIISDENKRKYIMHDWEFDNHIPLPRKDKKVN